MDKYRQERHRGEYNDNEIWFYTEKVVLETAKNIYKYIDKNIERRMEIQQDNTVEKWKEKQ